MAKTNNGKRHATQQSLNSAIKSICDVMRLSKSDSDREVGRPGERLLEELLFHP